MTDTEIYDRTLTILTAEDVKRFGESHALGPSRWITEVIARYLVAKYKMTRKRRPWCRLPWQRGRRLSPDPIAAKSKNRLHAKLRRMYFTNHKTGKSESAYDIFYSSQIRSDDSQ